HGRNPLQSGCNSEQSNGNGSLMRIAPLVFYVQNMGWQKRFEAVRKCSSITHAHIRSIIGCWYLVEYLRRLMKGDDKYQACSNLQPMPESRASIFELPVEEIKPYRRLLTRGFDKIPEESIQSSGYVVHTLEAAMWCFLTTDSYRAAVLKAVNLGGDTDTTGCVTGALAGLYYGEEAIPKEWLSVLARREDIETLAERAPKVVE
ncbi:MAG: ADP-ribosylglycohydrolase family protein, partial [Balneolaceae bacterium]